MCDFQLDTPFKYSPRSTTSTQQHNRKTGASRLTKNTHRHHHLYVQSDEDDDNDLGLLGDRSSMDSQSSGISISSGLSSHNTGVGLIGNNGVIEDVPVAKVKPKTSQNSNDDTAITTSANGGSNTPVPRPTTPGQPSQETQKAQESPGFSSPLTSPDSAAEASPTIATVAGSEREKTERVLRSSLSAHSFKQVFRMGVNRQNHERKKQQQQKHQQKTSLYGESSPSMSLPSPTAADSSSKTVANFFNSSNPASPAVSNPHYSQSPFTPPPPPTPTTSNHFPNDFKSSKSAKGSKNSKTSVAPQQEMLYRTASAQQHNDQIVSMANSAGLQDIGAGGVELSWEYAKPMICQAMREYRLMKDGSPVQWISSVNTSWSSGLGYITDYGELILQEETDSLEVPNLRRARVVASLKQRYIEMVLDPAQNGCTRVIITPTSDMDFFKWTGALVLWSNLKAEGLDTKITMPLLDLDPKNNDHVLVAHVKLCYPYVTNANTLKENGKEPSSRKGGLRRRASATPTATAASTNSTKTRNKDISSPLVPTMSEESPFGHDVVWIPAVAVLKQNGVLELLHESDTTPIQSIHMPSILSSRVRRIDYSLFDCPHVLYLQPSEGIMLSSVPRPAAGKGATNNKREYYFYMALPDIDHYEDWFSCLKAFTRKRIFSPTSMRINRSFRTSRKISVRILEAKTDIPLQQHQQQQQQEQQHHHHHHHRHHHQLGPQVDELSPLVDTYVEVQFEGLTWARTFVSNESRPFWREDFEFGDFPIRAPSLKFVVKRRLGSKVSPSQDPVVGTVVITDMDVIRADDMEQWYSMEPSKEFKDVGGCSLCVRLGYDQTEILSGKHYEQLHQLVTGNVANNLTIQIADQIPGELSKLSDILLNIFLTENKCVEWITSLIAAELGKIRESFAQSSSHITSDFRFNIDNTLFRGNSLVTKALERYMKLVGHSYLEKIVGGFVRKVTDVGLFLEVDPSRIPLQFIPEGQTAEDVSYENQEKLSKYVAYLWATIRDTTDEMPYSFKLLFKRLRVDLGSRLHQDEAVIFNSVAGFLFLRFFCPALLNPKICGLVQAHPVPHVQRSLTLIAKMLQGFANRVRFGLKEPWMVPLNSFIDAHDMEMEEFYREITLASQSELLLGANGIATERPFKEVPHTPALGDEYSNPYLIDQYENYAKLVNLWCTCRDQFSTAMPESMPAQAPTTIIDANTEILQLPPPRIKSGDTEHQERPSSTASSKFEDAISDALVDEPMSVKRMSIFSMPARPTNAATPVSPVARAQTPPVSSSGSMLDDTSTLTTTTATTNMNGLSGGVDSLRLDHATAADTTDHHHHHHQEDEQSKDKGPKEGDEVVSPTSSTSQNKRNTLIAMQEDALRQFELEALSVHTRTNEIEQALYGDEKIEDEDIESYVRNTHFSFNPDTQYVTLRKYPVSMSNQSAAAAAAAAQRSSYTPLQSSTTPMSVRSVPSKTSVPNLPHAAANGSARPQSSLENMENMEDISTTELHNTTSTSTNDGTNTSNNDDNSDKQSTTSRRRFPKLNFKFKRKT